MQIKTSEQALGLLYNSSQACGEGNGNPLQYSCLDTPMNRKAWWVTLHVGRKESDTTEATQQQGIA